MVTTLSKSGKENRTSKYDLAKQGSRSQPFLFLFLLFPSSHSHHIFQSDLGCGQHLKIVVPFDALWHFSDPI